MGLDEQAIARYRYLLRTAPPEAIEQAHAEAFAQLTPEQRAEVLRQLSDELPAGERTNAPRQADAESLARMATRAEMRRPGTLERSFGGVGMGGLLAGSLLSAVAGTFVGTAIAHQLLGGEGDTSAHDQGDADSGDAGAGDEVDASDSGDFGGGDFSDF